MFWTGPGSPLHKRRAVTGTQTNEVNQKSMVELMVTSVELMATSVDLMVTMVELMVTMVELMVPGSS